jgi:alpha-L-rhamnosidase
LIPIFFGQPIGSTGWADAGTIFLDMSWYGIERILEQQYISMKAWVDYMQTSGNFLDTGSFWVGFL